MASKIMHWQDGFGAAIATDPLAWADDIHHYADASTNLYFVNSATGSDSAGLGTRDYPYATLAAAIAVAGAGDIIVIMSGHTETLTATVTIAARVLIIGEGVGAARPTFTPNISSNGDAFVFTGLVHFRGIRIAASAQSTTGNQIDATAAGCAGSRISYCEFTANANNQGTQVAGPSGTNAIEINDTTFISSATAAAVASRPLRAFNEIFLCRNVTLSGGTYGWQEMSACDFGWGNTAYGPVGVGDITVCQWAMNDDARFDSNTSVNATIYTDGLGMTGHSLISGRGLYSLTPIVWVCSLTGTDAVGYGTSRNRPYASLYYATATAGASGLIVVLEGHTETVSVIIPVPTSTVIVGVGTGDNRPVFTNAVATYSFLSSTGGRCLLLNVRLAEATVAPLFSAIRIEHTDCVIDSCELEQGELNTSAGVYTISANTRVYNCTFTSVTETRASPPKHGLEANSTASNLMIDNCTFDGGALGWDDDYAAYLNATHTLATNITLLRNSMMVLDAYGYYVASDFIIQVAEATGGSGLLTKAFGP